MQASQLQLLRRTRLLFGGLRMCCESVDGECVSGDRTGEGMRRESDDGECRHSGLFCRARCEVRAAALSGGARFDSSAASQR